MKKRFIIIEDDKTFARKLSKYMRDRSYTIIHAADGMSAFNKIKSSKNPYDAMLLDLRMPNMSGSELLRDLNQAGVSFPPIAVLSAHFDRESVQLCLDLGVRCLFEKPIDLECIEIALSAIASNDEKKLLSLVEVSGSKIEPIYSPRTTLFCLPKELASILEKEDPIGSMVKARESSIERYFANNVDQLPSKLPDADEPLFIVARRWNSWYPSFFDVPGGCYAIVAPNANSGNRNCAVIDPGFRSLNILRSLGISVRDINVSVVSHNHPDHVGGLFEFIACRHALGLQTKGWFNRTTRSMFGDLSGFSFEINDIKETISDLLMSYENSHLKNREVLMTGFPVVHREIGRESSAMGLALTCRTKNPKRGRVVSECVVVGDSEYDRSKNQKFIELLSQSNLRFAVLHVGSVQLKQRHGGHLYYPGLHNILFDMDAAIERNGGRKGKLPILLSEWGLEHATKYQIKQICGVDIPTFDERSPMLDTADHLNKDLRFIRVLPADIGLMIGMETGSIYLRSGEALDVESIHPFIPEAGDGVRYERRY